MVFLYYFLGDFLTLKFLSFYWNFNFSFRFLGKGSLLFYKYSFFISSLCFMDALSSLVSLKICFFPLFLVWWLLFLSAFFLAFGLFGFRVLLETFPQMSGSLCDPLQLGHRSQCGAWRWAERVDQGHWQLAGSLGVVVVFQPLCGCWQPLSCHQGGHKGSHALGSHFPVVTLCSPVLLCFIIPRAPESGFCLVESK